ncbi:FCP1 domain containing protein [Trema orientale]|uniref:FCP1 domain containing protein n=1 Tax=Trema orientale TaxID=63057 RepID=A0A2P5D8T6_TREOI|nr:FCP1 domain containing protein [Trema orientale]
MDLDNALSGETSNYWEKKYERKRNNRSSFVPIREEATALESADNAITELLPTSKSKKQRKKGRRDDKTETDNTDHESASLESADNANTELLPTSKSKKQRKKRGGDSTEHESASLKSSVSKGDLHSASVAGTNGETSLERCTLESHSQSVGSGELVPTSEKKKKKKKSKSNEPKTNNTEHENLKGVTLKSAAEETEQLLLDGPHQTGLERTSNLERTTHHESASLKSSASKGDLHPEFVVGINGGTSSEKFPSESPVNSESVIGREVELTSGKKKKKKRSKSNNPEISNIKPENLNGAAMESTAKERAQQLEDGPGQSSVERTENLESPTPAADLSCSKVKKKRKRKRKQNKKNQLSEQNEHESNDKVNEFLQGTDMQNIVLDKTESFQPLVKASARTEPEAEHMDHTLQQNVGMLNQGVTDDKHSAEDFGNFVTEVVGLISADTLENPPATDEQNSFPGGVDTVSIKKHDDCTEVGHVLESSEIDTNKRKKRKRRSAKRKPSELGITLQPVEDNDVNGTSSGLLENIAASSLGIEAVSEQVVDILNEKDFSRSDIKPAPQERKKVSTCRNKSLNDASEVDVTVENYEQKNRGNLVREHDALGLDGNYHCKENGPSDLLKLDAVKIETIREEAPSSHYDEGKDRVHLEATTIEGNLSQLPRTLPERTLVARSQKQLLILDVNGLLVDFDQSHCTTTKFNTLENKNKPLVFKELRKLWEKLEPDLPWEKGEYDETNTLLLDDSPYKALRNPANTAIFPRPYRYGDRSDKSLGPGGDLRTYLEGLATTDNIQKYVECNPFGQEAITKSHKSWEFYSKLL